MSLTDNERHVMTHATAWPKCYRNHFCASEGHDDWSTLQALCGRGLMAVGRKPGPLSGGDTVFVVTDAGRTALGDAEGLLDAIQQAVDDWYPDDGETAADVVDKIIGILARRRGQ